MFSSVCVNCGIKISELEGGMRRYQNLMYCSTKCRSEKPQKVYKLEQYYGKNIKAILEEFLNKYQIHIVADMLEVSIYTIRSWIKKYEPNIKNRKYRFISEDVKKKQLSFT